MYFCQLPLTFGYWQNFSAAIVARLKSLQLLRTQWRRSELDFS
jgi:hypothetical protein